MFTYHPHASAVFVHAYRRDKDWKPSFISTLPGYKRAREILQLRSDSNLFAVVGPTGSGKSIGTVAVALLHVAHTAEDRRAKMLVVLPTRIAADHLHTQLSQAFNHEHPNLVGLLHAEASEYDQNSCVLIVTPGIAALMLSGQTWFTHVFLVCVVLSCGS